MNNFKVDLNMKFVVLVFIVLCTVVAIKCEKKVRYDNYTVYSIHPQNYEQLGYLQYIENNYPDILFFKPPLSIRQTIDVALPPRKYDHFHDLLNRQILKNEIRVRNLQR